jgi:hypothetical protein
MGVTTRHEQVLAEFNALRAAGVRPDGHPLGEATLRALDHDIARLESLLTLGADRQP